jgi:hypothetical protein
MGFLSAMTARVNEEAAKLKRIPPQNLEQLLAEMSQYGKVRLGQYTGLGTVAGWHCSIEMNVDIRGVNCEVKSKFNYETAKAAVEDCYENLQSLLRKM